MVSKAAFYRNLGVYFAICANQKPGESTIPMRAKLCGIGYLVIVPGRVSAGFMCRRVHTTGLKDRRISIAEIGDVGTHQILRKISEAPKPIMKSRRISMSNDYASIVSTTLF